MQEQSTEVLEASIQATLTPEEFQEYGRIRQGLESATTLTQVGDLDAGGFVTRMIEAHDIRKQLGGATQDSPNYRNFQDGMNALVELQNQKLSELK